MLLKGAVNNILPLLSLFIHVEIKDKRFQGGGVWSSRLANLSFTP